MIKLPNENRNSFHRHFHCLMFAPTKSGKSRSLSFSTVASVVDLVFFLFRCCATESVRIGFNCSFSVRSLFALLLIFLFYLCALLAINLHQFQKPRLYYLCVERHKAMYKHRFIKIECVRFSLALTCSLDPMSSRYILAHFVHFSASMRFHCAILPFVCLLLRFARCNFESSNFEK